MSNIRIIDVAFLKFAECDVTALNCKLSSMTHRVAAVCGLTIRSDTRQPIALTMPYKGGTL
jgi:hypothetical protein